MTEPRFNPGLSDCRACAALLERAGAPHHTCFGDRGVEGKRDASGSVYVGTFVDFNSSGRQVELSSSLPLPAFLRRDRDAVLKSERAQIIAPQRRGSRTSNSHSTQVHPTTLSLSPLPLMTNPVRQEERCNIPIFHKRSVICQGSWNTQILELHGHLSEGEQGFRQKPL